MIERREAYHIVFTEPGKAVLKKFQVMDPVGNQVLVKILYTLISNGTEKAYLSGKPNTGCKFPKVHGYCGVGIVEKIGEAVKNVAVGDRVFVSYGGHQSYSVRPETSITKIPDVVPWEEAIFLKIAGYPMAAIRRSRLELGESCVIVGLGMLGLIGVQIARLAGATPLIAIGNREIRQQKAMDYGADYVFSPSDPDLAKKIKQITKSVTTIEGASAIIETSGSESGLLTSFTYAAKWGRILLNGCQREMTQPLDFYQYVHRKGVQVIGVHNETRPGGNSMPGNWTVRRDFITVLNYMKDGRIHARDLLSEYVSPDDASKVYDRLLHDREFPLGVVFDWTKYHK